LVKAWYAERTLAIFEKMLGENHPHTRVVRGNLAVIARQLNGQKGCWGWFFQAVAWLVRWWRLWQG
jgi:hypothetical protein